MVSGGLLTRFQVLSRVLQAPKSVMPDSRKLSSLPLPRSTLSALAQVGYETLHDLQTASALKLANGQPFLRSSDNNPI